MYKFIKDGNGQTKNNFIFNLENNLIIPFIDGNRDYQEYLKWVAEGNTPLPADE